MSACSEHTPGPWFAAMVTDGKGNVGDANGFVHGLDGSSLEIRIEGANAAANARLISATPDLLAALQAMLKTHGKPHRSEWMNDAAYRQAQAVDAQARAAVAKATGASS